MGAQPKRKISRQRAGKRRAHLFEDFKKRISVVKCTHCGKLARPHHVCPFCGYYKNQLVG